MDFDFNIRRAELKDVDELILLLKQLFSLEADFEFDAEKQQKGLVLLLDSKEAVILVAEADEKVIGMCTMQILISTVEGARVGLIEDMVVDERYRGKGVGAILLKTMEIEAVSLGLSRIQLLADLENKPALEFYQKNNWQKTQLICYRKK